MDVERWQEVWSVFHRALDAAPEDRQAVLDRLCDDPDLRREVASLLAAHEGEDPLLDHPERLAGQPSGDFRPAPAASRLEGETVGAYRLLRLLGSGGMGSVYLAERADEEFEHRVAIKLIQPGLDSTDIVERFHRERQILARLDHPHIARLFDGGHWRGRPYFVLEHVEGETIDVWARDPQVRQRDILALVRQVCYAVQFAHQNLIVHRDLKPSNILVTADGTPKLLDFGVAKLLSTDAGVTATASRMMTPRYASPEQIRGEAVTTLSDVYSLGVLLYELVTGEFPYRPRSDLPHEVARAILEDEPLSPSTAVRRKTDTGATDAQVGDNERHERPLRPIERDLDTIVLKALSKDPQHRYASAEQLGEDLQRFLDGLPVLARPASVLYRASKFVRRHALSVTAGTAAVLLLLLTTAVAMRQTSRTREALAEAARQRDVAESVVEFLRQTFVAAGPFAAEGPAFSAKELLDRGADRALSELGDQPEVRASVHYTLGTVYSDMNAFEESERELLQALELQERLFGRRDPRVGNVLRAVGGMRANQGRYRDAEPLLREALDILRPSVGNDDLLVGLAEKNLGVVRHALGDDAEAESLLRDAVRIIELSSDEDLEADVKSHLGMVLRSRARFEEAESTLLEALAMRQRRGDESNPRVAMAHRQLGDLYTEWGALERAEHHYREALIGIPPEREAATLGGLGTVLRSRGDLAGAESLYRQALETGVSRLGEVNPFTASHLNNLALVLQEKGELEEAEALFRRVLDLNTRIFGEDHPSRIANLNNLGLVLQAKGDLDGAQETYRAAEELARRSLGDRHPAVAFPLNNRGELAFERGDLEAAEELFQEALELRRASLAEGSADLAPSLGGLGRVLTDFGRTEEAEPLLREALALRRRHRPEEDWHVAWAQADLGACLVAQGHLGEAAPLLETALARLEATKGPDDPRTVRARTWLARLEELRRAGSGRG